MNAHLAAALAVVLLIASAPLARAENAAIGQVSTTRLKTVPGVNSGTKGRNNAPIMTSRSNIKHAIPQQPGRLPTCQPGKKC